MSYFKQHFSPSSPKRSENDDDQMMIDAGQKEFGAKHCPECGLLYEVGSASDKVSHEHYHNHLLVALKYTVSIGLSLFFLCFFYLYNAGFYETL